MKKIFNVLALGLFIVVLLVVADPYKANAAWYNPLTWFHHGTSVQVPVEGSISPIATSTQVNTPSSTTNDVRAIECDYTSYNKQIAVLTTSVASLQGTHASDQLTINAKNAQISALTAQVTALHTLGGGTTTVVTPPTPKTREQLEAQYKTANPLPACSITDSPTLDSSYCTHKQLDYYAAVNVWVNAQLATQ